MAEHILRSRCECGWEVTGPVDDVVAATIEHGSRIHNMQATPDEVRARAEVVDDATMPEAGTAA